MIEDVKEQNGYNKAITKYCDIREKYKGIVFEKIQSFY